jgi:glycosyltransferase involved in cell wall biosynthesis
MKNIKIIVAHPTGNANVRYLITALLKSHMLSGFYTCVALFENTVLYNILKAGPLKEFTKRSFSPQLKHYTHTKAFKEIARIVATKFGISSLIKHETGLFSVDAVYKDLDKHVSKKLNNQSAVYAYEDGALDIFLKAKDKNIVCLYDLPIGYWRSMRYFLEQERVQRPEWAVTLTGFNDSDSKLERKDKELELAQHIFVASSFTLKTLEMFPGSLPKVSVIPYGFPDVVKNRIYNDVSRRKIKLLFVGGLSQRKGIANVFEAADFLSEYVELTVVGKKAAEDCKPLNEGLKRHNWIPALPHDEVLNTMREHDILVFPSLFEGYGLVIAEAMSQGTPVISTDRTCAADMIKDNVNGWIVDVGNTQSLIDKIKDIIEKPCIIETMGRAAMRTAQQRPSTMYGDEIVNEIKAILNSK